MERSFPFSPALAISGNIHNVLRVFSSSRRNSSSSDADKQSRGAALRYLPILILKWKLKERTAGREWESIHYIWSRWSFQGDEHAANFPFFTHEVNFLASQLLWLLILNQVTSLLQWRGHSWGALAECARYFLLQIFAWFPFLVCWVPWLSPWYVHSQGCWNGRHCLDFPVLSHIRSLS